MTAKKQVIRVDLNEPFVGVVRGILRELASDEPTPEQGLVFGDLVRGVTQELWTALQSRLDALEFSEENRLLLWHSIVLVSLNHVIEDFFQGKFVVVGLGD